MFSLPLAQNPNWTNDGLAGSVRVRNHHDNNTNGIVQLINQISPHQTLSSRVDSRWPQLIIRLREGSSQHFTFLCLQSLALVKQCRVSRQMKVQPQHGDGGSTNPSVSTTLFCFGRPISNYFCGKYIQMIRTSKLCWSSTNHLPHPGILCTVEDQFKSIVNYVVTKTFL